MLDGRDVLNGRDILDGCILARGMSDGSSGMSHGASDISDGTSGMSVDGGVFDGGATFDGSDTFDEDLLDARGFEAALFDNRVICLLTLIFL